MRFLSGSATAAVAASGERVAIEGGGDAELAWDAAEERITGDG